MSELPDELVPDGKKIVSDQTECTKCGREPYGGHFRDGDFYCTVCNLKVDDDVVEIEGNSALCECGNETSFKEWSKWGELWICPRCGEGFSGVCDECGREACTTAVFGKKGSYCRDCIEEGGA